MKQGKFSVILFALSFVILVGDSRTLSADDLRLQTLYVAAFEKVSGANKVWEISIERQMAQLVWELPLISEAPARELLSPHEAEILEHWPEFVLPVQGALNPVDETLSQYISNIWKLSNSEILILLKQQRCVFTSGHYCVGDYRLITLDLNTKEQRLIWSVGYSDPIREQLPKFYGYVTINDVQPNSIADQVAITLQAQPLSSCCEYRKSTVVIDYSSEQPSQILLKSVGDIAWSPDGKKLLLRDSEDAIHVLDTSTRNITFVDQLQPNRCGSNQSIAVGWFNNHIAAYHHYDSMGGSDICLVDLVANNLDTGKQSTLSISETVIGLVYLKDGTNVLLFGFSEGMLETFEFDQNIALRNSSAIDVTNIYPSPNISQLLLGDNRLMGSYAGRVFYNPKHPEVVMISQTDDLRKLSAFDAQLNETRIDFTLLGLPESETIFDISY